LPHFVTIVSDTTQLETMNLDHANHKLLYMSFNQSGTCVAVGTRNGYRIYNCEPFGRNIFSTDGGIGTVRMLFCTSLICLVGAGETPAFSPRRLKLWNTKTASSICELNFPTNILNVELNHKRLVVALEDKLHIYDLEKMTNLQTLETHATGPKQRTGAPSGVSVCALSPNHQRNCYLALPANNHTGDVLLYDTLNLTEFKIIHAHKTPVAALAFSMDGSLLSTASETGTIIRVFAVPSGERLHAFRRGSYGARIFSMAFDERNTMMAVSSSTGTIHVFNLVPSGDEIESDKLSMEGRNSVTSGSSGAPVVHQGSSSGEKASSAGSVSSWIPGLTGKSGSARSSLYNLLPTSTLDTIAFERRKLVAGMLPESISDFVEPARSFAYAKIASSNSAVATVCSLSEGYLRVVSSDGHFYQYCVQRGECQLVFEIALEDGESSSSDPNDSQGK